ncbi:MAG: N-acetylglucosaminyltransferase [Gammaproteobacteria bacterium]|nr:N-acetylglucosaminyltransferase [Gammaproteobacteria bacterium]
MIYDCFAFFNELDLLEIRLNELDHVVDKFVLVEATRTFQKQPKPLYFEENKSRFKNFEDKIIHIVVDEYPNFFTRFRIPTPMDYDNHQKNQVIRGLKDAKPDDVIIYSDLDEIPNPEKITEYSKKPGYKVFEQRFLSYFINCAVVNCPVEPTLPFKMGQIWWRGSVMANYKEFNDTKSFRKMRDYSEDKITLIENGGWHFSYLGGLEQVLYKLQSFAHTKENKYGIKKAIDRAELETLLSEGRDILGRDISYKFIPLDSSFPEYIIKNKDKFSALIKN